MAVRGREGEGNGEVGLQVSEVIDFCSVFNCLEGREGGGAERIRFVIKT